MLQKASQIPQLLKWNGRNVFGPKKWAALASVLASNFITPIHQIPTDIDWLEETARTIFQLYRDETHLPLWDGYDADVTPTMMLKLINELNPRKDPGPMQISAAFLRNNAELLAPALTKVMNAVIRTGIVPASWKNCYMVPIPKKGSLLDANNYRGIAIQSSIPKLLDKWITARLFESLDSTIPVQQHGYRAKRGTITNLLEISHHLHLAKLHSTQMDVIYLDFSRAFDTIDHLRLMKKLAAMAMPFELHRLVFSFISGRRYRIKTGGIVTGEELVPCSGVPQGSHCGPVLFALYCADLPSCITHSHCLMYADDTKVFKEIRSNDDVRQLQGDIDALVEWAVENGPALNPSKTIHVTYGPRRINSIYYIGTEAINRQTQMRDLGVIFDEKLNFKPHIQGMIKRVRSMIGAAYRFTREVGEPNLIMKVFNVYMRPILEYGHPIWDQATVRLTEDIERLQHTVTSMALRNPRWNVAGYQSYFPRLILLTTIPLKDRREMQVIILTSKLVNGLTLSPVADTIRTFRITHIFLTRAANIFNGFNRRTGKNEPIRLMMTKVNTRRAVVDFLVDSPGTLKGKLLDLFRRQLAPTE